MPHGLTYADLLERFPQETNRRIELIDGEPLMPPAPSVRHQEVVMRIGVRLSLHGERQGGLVLASPMDVLLTKHDVVQPDVLYLLPEHAEGAERPLTRLDLAVEVSSPNTRRTDTVLKRNLYQRHGVPEHWFVGLATDRILVHRLEGGRYPDPKVLGPEDVLTSPLLPGFSARVGDLLAL